MFDKVLVDGNNLAHRTFYTQGKLSVDVFEKGQRKTLMTGVLFGFVQTMLMLKQRYGATPIIVWDRGRNRRIKIDPEYKANRNKDWDEYENFCEQRRLAEDVLPILGVDQVYKEGEEADDVIGSLAHQYAKKDFKVLICSSDHDFYQLIGGNIFQYKQAYKQSDKLYNEERFIEDKGVTPKEYLKMMCLMGDPGDNIKGIKGIGEKTALKIIRAMPNIIAHSHKGEIKGLYNSGLTQSIINKLEDQEEYIEMTRKLVTIYKGFKLLNWIKSDKDLVYLEALFSDYKFNTFLKHDRWEVIEKL